MLVNILGYSLNEAIKASVQQFFIFPAAMALMLLKEERIDFTSAIG